MALDRGQTEYARMMMRLESNPPTATDAAKLPDDFHYGGHTAHDSDDLPHTMITPHAEVQQPAIDAPGNLDELSKIMFSQPDAPSAAAPAKSEEGADMLYALYGFSDFKPHTHIYTFRKSDGSLLTVLTDTYTPRLDDSCHLRVVYSRSETTDGKPFFGPHNTAYLYDFTKMADIGIDIIANPAQGIARMVGGTLDDMRPMVIYTTAVGAGAKCDVGTQPPRCNTANETITDIHDPDVSMPLLRKAYEAAKARCKGA